MADPASEEGTLQTGPDKRTPSLYRRYEGIPPCYICSCDIRHDDEGPIMRAALATLALATMMTHAGAATITVGQRSADAERSVVYLSGPIVVGDAARVSALDYLGRNVDLVLQSNGGLTVEALSIGRFIRDHGWSTEVRGGAECASSCALIWLGGTSRWMSPTSRVGFHDAYTIENGIKTVAGGYNALVGAYMARLDFPDSAIYFASQAKPNEIAWLEPIDGGTHGIAYRVGMKLSPPLDLQRADILQIASAVQKSPAAVADTPPPLPQPPPARQQPKLDQVARLLDQMPDDRPLRKTSPLIVPSAEKASEPSKLLKGTVERAGLLVDAPGDPQKYKTFVGYVVWHNESVSVGQGQPLMTAVRAQIEIPDAKVSLSMLFKKNMEPQFPASHTIEFHFIEGPGNTLGPVKQINVPEMRRDDAALTGEPLIGVPVAITGDNFLVGMARGAAEQGNIQLLGQRNWVDVSILLASGKIAKITFEKGQSGKEILDAFFVPDRTGTSRVEPRTGSSPSAQKIKSDGFFAWMFGDGDQGLNGATANKH